MNKTDYQKALQAAKAEFERLIHERVELDERIVRLKQTIAGLSGLLEPNGHAIRSLNNIVPLPPRFMRLTSAIRRALADAISPMRPPNLRDALLHLAPKMTQYANKLAVIHNTLARLERQGEVTELADGWTLTEKGRLASKMDSLDFAPPIPLEADPDHRPADPTEKGESPPKRRRRRVH